MKAPRFHTTPRATQVVGLLASALLAGAASSSVRAVDEPPLLSITVGDHALLADHLDPQSIDLRVQNDGPPITVGSLDFFLQLGDGTGTSPRISQVDLVTGTAFQSNNGGQFSFGANQDQLQYYAVTKAGGGSGPALPTGSSLLASVSIVTAGAGPGAWMLSISGTDWGDTAFNTDTAIPELLGTTRVNGYLTLVPEPTEAAIVVGAGLGAWVAWRRRGMGFRR